MGYRACSIISGEDKHEQGTIYHTYLTTLILFCTEYKLPWKKIISTELDMSTISGQKVG